MHDRLCRWLLALLICTLACPAIGGDKEPPASAPTTAPVVFNCAKYGFSVQLAADWAQVKGDADVPLSLVPQSQADDKDLSQVPSLKMQVPVLPMHIPGMIPVGSVANGYVDDLRKENPDLKVDERVAVTIPGASARRILTSYTEGKTPWRDIALCIVHKDRVFLIVGDCQTKDYPATRAAFDAMAASLKWIQ